MYHLLPAKNLLNAEQIINGQNTVHWGIIKRDVRGQVSKSCNECLFSSLLNSSFFCWFSIYPDQHSGLVCHSDFCINIDSKVTGWCMTSDVWQMRSERLSKCAVPLSVHKTQLEIRVTLENWECGRPLRIDSNAELALRIGKVQHCIPGQISTQW